jgi:Mitochondrial resolvase Ydc2 / RNA splicing MRS1
MQNENVDALGGSLSSQYKIISFDVGIKNMAYCIFDISGETMFIQDWNTLNLLETAPTNKTCNQCLANKKRSEICGKRAKYEKDEQFYCETHAKKSNFMMPSKNTYPAFLNKQNLGNLHRITMTYNIENIALKEKRQDLIKKILDFFEKRCLKLVENKQGPNAKKESLITIARNIRDKLDKIESLKGITDILIENQISPIASRMTTIQGLLTQYFVMRHDPIQSVNIEFISSRNKLKNFVKESVKEENEGSPQTETITERQKYKNHKMDSIVYTRQLMDKFPNFKRWESVLDTPKKDDLADCFLQGIWYITENILKAGEPTV